MRDRISAGLRPRAARAFVGVGAVLLAGRAVTAQEAPNLAVSTPPAAEVTVDRALKGGVEFLVTHQNEDGSFGHHTAGRPWEIMADVPGSHHAFKAATARKRNRCAFVIEE